MAKHTAPIRSCGAPGGQSFGESTASASCVEASFGLYVMILSRFTLRIFALRPTSCLSKASSLNVYTTIGAVDVKEFCRGKMDYHFSNFVLQSSLRCRSSVISHNILEKTTLLVRGLTASKYLVEDAGVTKVSTMDLSNARVEHREPLVLWYTLDIVE